VQEKAFNFTQGTAIYKFPHTSQVESIAVLELAAAHDAMPAGAQQVL